MPSSQCRHARIQAPVKIHASYLVIMSHYCPQFETKSPLPLVLHDIESSLESRSAVLQNIAHLDSSLSWNSVEVRHLRQGWHAAEAEYLPFHALRGHMMKSHHMKDDAIGVVFSVFLHSRGGWGHLFMGVDFTVIPPLLVSAWLSTAA